MAFDLVARLKVKDEMSGKLRKVQTQLDATKRSSDAFSDRLRMLGRRNDIFTSGAERASRMLSSMTKGFSSARDGASRLSSSVGLLAAGYLTAQTAASAFNKTIGAAAQYEMRSVTVEAMFGKDSKQNVDKFMNFVSSRADVSQFTLDEFLDAGKSFIPTTKDNKQLEKMVNLAERLGALDPEQGITGASYALKELFSGDGLSLVERFELPRSAINQIKKLPIKDQLVQLDKFLNKIGATNELIDAQSKTAMGQWRTAIGGVNRAFREMGTDALTSIKPMLAEFNNWIKGPQFTALKTWGVDAFSGLVEGAVKSVREATSYIQSHFINNPKFQKLPDISSKIKFVFDDLMQNFRDWYSGGGANKIKTMASNIVDTLGMALKASRPLLEAATEIGRKVGASILEGIWSNSGIEEFFSIDMKSVANRKLTGTDMMQIAAEYGGDKTPGGVKAGMVAMGVTPKGHSGGLDRVPYSGYTARLHQDEMVLTSQEARDYRESSNGKSAPTIMITGNTFNVRKDSDIEAIAGVLAARLAM